MLWYNTVFITIISMKNYSISNIQSLTVKFTFVSTAGTDAHMTTLLP